MLHLWIALLSIGLFKGLVVQLMAISYSGTHRKHTDGNRNVTLKNEANAAEHVF